MSHLEMDVDRELAAYGLRADPFQSGTNLQFLWRGGAYGNVLTRLKAAILDNRGLLVLTGEMGTGKTLLAHALVEELGDAVIVARVVCGSPEPFDFLQVLASACGLSAVAADPVLLHDRLEQFLADAGSRGTRLLLVIDEAQSLERERFAEILHLTSIGINGSNRLNLLLVGQSELNAILAEPEHAALIEQVAIRATLAPLTEREVRRYVQHRLRIAGASRSVFTPGAMREIIAFSQGIPRLVNVIGDLALVSGHRRRSGRVGADVVKECAGTLGRPRRKAQTPRRRREAMLSAAPEQHEDARAASPPPTPWPGDNGDSASLHSPGEAPEAARCEPEILPAVHVESNGGGTPAHATIARNGGSGMPEGESWPARSSAAAREPVLPAARLREADEEAPTPRRASPPSGTRNGRVRRLAPYALVTALLLASVGYLQYSGHSPDPQFGAPSAAPSYPASADGRSDPSGGATTVQAEQTSAIETVAEAARQEFLEFRPASVSPTPLSPPPPDRLFDGRPTGALAANRIPPTITQAARPPVRVPDNPVRIPDIPVSALPVEKRVTDAAADSMDPGAIIDWLLKEFPARTP